MYAKRRRHLWQCVCRDLALDGWPDDRGSTLRAGRRRLRSSRMEVRAWPLCNGCGFSEFFVCCLLPKEWSRLPSCVLVLKPGDGVGRRPPLVSSSCIKKTCTCVSCLPPSLRPTYVQRPYLLTYLTNYLLSYMIIHTGRTGILYIDHDITILNEVSNSGARTDRE